MTSKKILIWCVLSIFVLLFNLGADYQLSLNSLMQYLSEHMNTMSHAMWTENFDQIKRSAEAISSHLPVSEAEIVRVSEALQNDYQQYQRYNMALHIHADSIALAANQKDIKKVLYYYHEVQKACVYCHSTHRLTLQTLPAKEPLQP